MLGRAMIQWDRIELILVAVIGAVLGGISGIVLGHDALAYLSGHSLAQSLSAGLFIALGFFVK